MSYEVPRAAKLLVEVQSKYIGIGAGRTHKAGKRCKVQRNPSNPGEFVIWFGKTEIAKVQALDLTSTIEYTDGRPQY
ncbi:hypothetical protein P0D69_28010 [Paraburkholderia sediminicola]|uniref:hypothetical protein n=1 Tax=Paraburkholderia sediminicola TaxID=458836 RepID=UPI0038B9C4DA